LRRAPIVLEETTFTMPKPAPAVSLSSQEREILRLVRRGCRDVEIAGNLSLPLDAVTTCLQEISQKIAVRDRLELATFAARFDS
jgi:DNA-binding NarL/FixJ family response regulator